MHPPPSRGSLSNSPIASQRTWSAPDCTQLMTPTAKTQRHEPKYCRFTAQADKQTDVNEAFTYRRRFALGNNQPFWYHRIFVIVRNMVPYRVVSGNVWSYNFTNVCVCVYSEVEWGQEHWVDCHSWYHTHTAYWCGQEGTFVQPPTGCHSVSVHLSIFSQGICLRHTAAPSPSV